MTTYTAGSYIDLNGNIFSVNERAKQILDSFSLAEEFASRLNPTATPLVGSARTFASGSTSALPLARIGQGSAFRLYLSDDQFSRSATPSAAETDTTLNVREAVRELRTGSLIVLRTDPWTVYMVATAGPQSVSGGSYIEVRSVAVLGSPVTLVAGSASRVTVIARPDTVLSEQFVDPVNLLREESEFPNVTNLAVAVEDALQLRYVGLRKLTRHIIGPQDRIALGDLTRGANDVVPTRANTYAFNSGLNLIYVLPSGAAKTHISTYWRDGLRVELARPNGTAYTITLTDAVLREEGGVYVASFGTDDSDPPPLAYTGEINLLPSLAGADDGGEPFTPEAFYQALRRALLSGNRTTITPNDVARTLRIDATVEPVYYTLANYGMTPAIASGVYAAGDGIGSLDSLPTLTLPDYITTQEAQLAQVRVTSSELQLRMATAGTPRFQTDARRYTTFRVRIVSQGSVYIKSVATPAAGGQFRISLSDGNATLGIPLTTAEATELQSAFSNRARTTVTVQTSDFDIWYADTALTRTAAVPEATEKVPGTVRGADETEAADTNGTDIRGWSATRIGQLIAKLLPTVSSSAAQAATSNNRRIFTPALVRESIEALVPSWARATNPPSSDFEPTQANLFSAVRGMFVHAGNTGVTADDDNNEIDIAATGGSGGQLTRTLIGSAATVGTDERQVVFSTTTRDAIFTAWNSVTYHSFEIRLSWSDNGDHRTTLGPIPRWPNAIGEGPGEFYRITMPLAESSGSAAYDAELVLDRQSTTQAVRLRVLNTTENLPTGATVEFYGISGGGGSSGTGLNQGQVDARIFPAARRVPVGTFTDDQIPAEIARDTEVTAAVAAEATSRTTADTALGARIDGEATARSTADTALGTRIDNLNVPDKASNADIDAETDNSDYVSVLGVFRAIARKVKNASTTVRGIVLIARNTDVDATETDTSRVPDVAKVKRLVARIAPVFMPTQANIYAAVKAIFEHNSAVTPDDTDHELDITTTAGGGGLNQAQVDDRVRVGTLAPARTGNTDRWGKSKVPSDTVYDDDISGLATDADLATETARREAADTALGNRIDNLPSGGGPSAPFASIRMYPGGIVDSEFPNSVYFALNEKLDPREIDGLTCVIGGQTLTLNTTSTPVSSFNTETTALARLDLSTQQQEALTQNSSGRISQDVILTFSFTSGDDYVYNVTFPVNNPTFTPAPAPTSGLTRSQVLALIADEAETGNTSRWPKSKLPSDTVYTAGLQTATAALGSRIDAIPVYTALLSVWPPNVATHTDVQRKFQSTLARLDPGLATNAGSTGTRFTNTFRIFARNADGDVVQLHTQGWSFTADNRQSIPWEVDATEFNRLGTESATTGLEVWGEFRAIYGGGVNEFRGRTNPVFIDFGEESAWPATRGEAQEARSAEAKIRDGGDTYVTRNVGSSAEMAAAIRAHDGSNTSSLFVITSTFRTTHRAYAAGERWALARHHDAEAEMTLFVPDSAGRDDTARQAAADAQTTANENRAEIMSEETARRDADTELGKRIDGLTTSPTQRIADLALIPEPAVIAFANQTALEKAVARVQIGIPNPELLTGDVWVSGELQGQPALARTKWASTTSSLTLTVSESVAQSIASGIATDSELEVRLRFFDAATGGNEIERTGFNIPLVSLGASGGPEGVPDAPAHVATAKRYQLAVPAVSGTNTWEEDTSANYNIVETTAANLPDADKQLANTLYIVVG